MLKQIFWRVMSIVLLVALIFMWQVLASKYANTQLLPTPLQVWSEFLEMNSEDKIVISIKDSLIRFAVGFILGSICAIILGLFLGLYKNVEILLEPLIQLLRPISPIAWFPLVVLWMNIGDVPAIFIIFYAVFFPVLALCIAGVRQINKEYILMAKNFGASALRIFFNIILPGTFLHIASGLKLAASVAWIHLVAGEMMGSQTGLGYLIVDGRNFLNTAQVIVGMFLIGIFGYAIYAFFVFLEKAVIRKLGSRF